MYTTNFKSLINLPGGTLTTVAIGLALSGLSIEGESSVNAVTTLITNRALTSAEVLAIAAAAMASIVTGGASAPA